MIYKFNSVLSFTLKGIISGSIITAIAVATAFASIRADVPEAAMPKNGDKYDHVLISQENIDSSKEADMPNPWETVTMDEAFLYLGASFSFEPPTGYELAEVTVLADPYAEYMTRSARFAYTNGDDEMYRVHIHKDLAAEIINQGYPIDEDETLYYGEEESSISYVQEGYLIMIDMNGKSKDELIKVAGSVAIVELDNSIEKSAGIVNTEMQSNDFKLSIETVMVKTSSPEIGWDEPRVIGMYELPVVSGIGDKDFERDLNRHFEEEAEDSLEDFFEDFDHAIEDYLNSLDKSDDDVTAFALASLNGAEYLSKTHLLSEAEGFLTLANQVYTFTGGAHGDEYLTAFNIDLVRQRTLELEDMFKREYRNTYEKKLLDIINSIAGNDPAYADKLFMDEAITDIDDDDFFIADGKLIVFYQPNEIGPRSAGIICFKIEFSEIQDMMNERYTALIFADRMSIHELLSY